MGYRKLLMRILCGLSAVITIIALLRFQFPNIGISLDPSLLIAGLAILALALTVAIDPKVKINIFLALLCVEMLCSNIVNRPPEYFESYQRLGYFVLMLMFLSPLLSNKVIEFARRWSWAIYTWGMVVLLYGSFLIYCIGKANGEIFWSFKGLVNHGNLLGVVCAFSLILAVCRLLRCAVKSWWLIFWIATATISLPLLIATASRACIFGSIISVIAILLIAGVKGERRRSSIIFVGFMIAELFCVSFGERRGIEYKNNASKEHNSITYSRDELWNARYQEFKESPILGVGVAVSTHYSPTFDEVDESGNITDNTEPGSAWLSLLANCGLLGAVIFGCFVWQYIRRLWFGMKQRLPETILYIGLSIFLLIQGNFEGWLLYGGSLTFFMFWLMSSKVFELKRADSAALASKRPNPTKLESKS